MLGAIVGYVEGADGADFMDVVNVGAVMGLVVTGLTVISMALGMVTGIELTLLQNVTLHGALLGNLAGGLSGALGGFAAVLLAGVYAFGDTVVGYGLYKLVTELQEL